MLKLLLLLCRIFFWIEVVLYKGMQLPSLSEIVIKTSKTMKQFIANLVDTEISNLFYRNQLLNKSISEKLIFFSSNFSFDSTNKDVNIGKIPFSKNKTTAWYTYTFVMGDFQTVICFLFCGPPSTKIIIRTSS